MDETTPEREERFALVVARFAFVVAREPEREVRFPESEFTVVVRELIDHERVLTVVVRFAREPEIVRIFAVFIFV
jgi:hypothetical protein